MNNLGSLGTTLYLSYLYLGLMYGCFVLDTFGVVSLASIANDREKWGFGLETKSNAH